jgi:hypothetical protein
MEQCGQGTKRLQQPAVEMEKADKREEKESIEQCSQTDWRLRRAGCSATVVPRSELSVCDLGP